MTVFQYSKYQEFLRAWVEARPKKGRGEFRAMAEHLRISPVLMSQVVNGARSLSEDHAFLLGEYMNLSDMESDYFLLLVQKERAGSVVYRKRLDQKLLQIKKEAEKPKNRVAQDATLTEEAKAVFYSHWKYSMIRLASSLPGLDSVDRIADHLGLHRAEVAEAIQFLLTHQLCVQTKDGISMGPQRTHLAKESPFYLNRQFQLRQLGLRALEKKSDQDLFYSSPVSISKKDAEWLRELLLDSVSKLSKKIETTDATELYGLNIDWFQLPVR